MNVKTYKKIKLNAVVKSTMKRTTISPIFFPLSCEWINNNSCSIFACCITDFEISRTAKIIVSLCVAWWTVKVKWYCYFRHQLPHRIYIKYFKRKTSGKQAASGLPF